MNNNNNKGIIWGVLVLAIIVLGIVFYMKSKEPAVVVEQQNETPVTTPDKNVTTDSGSTNNNTGVKAASIAYTDALVKYKDRRIQLDKACQANPNIVTYKDNTGIMIDNRSDKDRTVKVGTNYTIKAWGFKIVVLPDIYLKSKTLLVDCDKSQNVATILVQE